MADLSAPSGPPREDPCEYCGGTNGLHAVRCAGFKPAAVKPLSPEEIQRLRFLLSDYEWNKADPDAMPPF